jgi:hypothetical protein
MTTDEEPVSVGDADLDLYAVGANIPGGAGVVWVTAIDHSDGVFAGQWVDEERV